MPEHEIETEITNDPDDMPEWWTLRAWCSCGWDMPPEDYRSLDEAAHVADHLSCPRAGDSCSECGEDRASGDYGMCAACLHNALRSGWVPGK